MMIAKATLLTGLLASAGFAAAGGEVPSRFGVDAPQLAHLGDYAVGVRAVRLVERNQPDVLSIDATGGRAVRRDRELMVEVWYPARPAATAVTPIQYTASLPAEPPRAPVSFTVSGIAVRNAPAAAVAGGFPLVIVSHGYSNDPFTMTWLTENLASKGYVVAAIRHGDPPITDRSKFAQLLLRRPLDIAFVARSLTQSLSAERLVDPSRLALIGYSMGGYGVLTAAGATLDPAGPVAAMVPGKLLAPYERGGTLERSVVVKAVRAVVAISPAGGGTLAAWGDLGMRGIKIPLLLVAGDQDHTVDYATGARAFFDSALDAERYLLTFKNAGHSIGLGPAPADMRRRLWDQDWFEDPVWRKDRLNSIEAHFITAFLNRHVKGDGSFAAFLDVPSAESEAGKWPAAAAPAAYDAYSPASGDVTVWKGFQHNHDTGLELLHLSPRRPPG
ncbi:MAG: dienelactone hydrolase [Pseudomonadota bacterium]|nr:dienelactone hydrolase [Pseudomonadota bacterium]